MRLVLDTDVVVTAARSDRGLSRQLLEGALRGRFVLLVSVPLLLEYEAVLSRREHELAGDYTSKDVAALLDGLNAVSERVLLSFVWRPMLADPADEMVLETAINGRADAVVTFNQRYFAPATRRFGIAVWRPGETLSRLEE